MEVLVNYDNKHNCFCSAANANDSLSTLAVHSSTWLTEPGKEIPSANSVAKKASHALKVCYDNGHWNCAVFHIVI